MSRLYLLAPPDAETTRRTRRDPGIPHGSGTEDRSAEHPGAWPVVRTDGPARSRSLPEVGVSSRSRSFAERLRDLSHRSEPIHHDLVVRDLPADRALHECKEVEESKRV